MLLQRRWRVTSAHSVDHISPATAISLIEDINPARAAVQQFLEAQTGRFDAVVAGDPHRAALKMLQKIIRSRRLLRFLPDPASPVNHPPSCLQPEADWQGSSSLGVGLLFPARLCTGKAAGMDRGSIDGGQTPGARADCSPLAGRLPGR